MQDSLDMLLRYNPTTHIPMNHVIKKMEKWTKKWPELRIEKKSFPKKIDLLSKFAVEVGFEPTHPVRVRFSKPVQLAAMRLHQNVVMVGSTSCYCVSSKVLNVSSGSYATPPSVSESGVQRFIAATPPQRNLATILPRKQS